MSIYFHVYIGPYVQIDADSTFEPYDLLGDQFSYPLREQDYKTRLKTLIPNKSTSYILNYSRHDDDGVASITPEFIEEGLTKFKKEYEKELVLLGEHVTSIKVKWGAIGYYS